MKERVGWLYRSKKVVVVVVVDVEQDVFNVEPDKNCTGGGTDRELVTIGLPELILSRNYPLEIHIKCPRVIVSDAAMLL